MMPYLYAVRRPFQAARERGMPVMFVTTMKSIQ